MNAFNSLSIRSKLLASFAVVIALVLIMAVAGYFQLSNARDVGEHMVPDSMQMSSLQEFAVLMASLESNLDQAFVTGGESFREGAQNSVQELLIVMESLKAHAESEDQPVTDAITRDLDLATSQLGTEVNASLEAGLTGLPSRGVNEQIVSTYLQLSLVNSLHNELTEATLLQISEDVVAQEDTISSVISQFLVLTVLVASSGIVLSVVLSSFLSRPIVKLKTLADEIAGGNLDIEIKTRSRDEIGELALAFNTMASNLNTELAERRQAEEALRESEERHRSLFETMGQGVVYQTVGGEITAANPAAERILGLTFDQMAGRTSMDPRWRTMREDGSDLAGEDHPSMVALRTGEEVLNVVMGVFNPEDDSHRWISVSAVPQFQAGAAEPYRVYTTFTDITAQVVAAEWLRESVVRFRSFAKNAPDFVMQLDRDGTILFINRTHEGLSEEDVTGTSVFEWLPHGHRPEFERALARVFDMAQPQVLEHLGLIPDGEARWYSTHLGPIEVDGAVTGAIAVARDITERKKTEDALRESEEKLRLLFESVSDAVFVTDLDANIVDVNRRGLEVGGAESREELIGRNAFDFVPARDRDRMITNMQRTMREGPRPIEYTMLRIDGTEYPAETTTAVLRDASGDPVGLVSVIRDITERKRAEADLRFKDHVIRSASSVIATCDLEGSMTYVNPSFLDLWGFESDAEIIGRPFPEFWMVGDRIDGIMKDLGAEGVWSGEIQARRRDGSLFDVQVAAATVYDGEGNPVALMSTSIDITVRRMMEDELRRERDKSQTYLDVAGVMLIVLDSEAKVALVNRRGCEILGYQESEIVGKNWFENFLPAEARGGVQAVFDGLIAGETEPFEYFENAVLTRAGEERVMAWHNVLLHGEGGSIVGTLGSAEDITERKKAEDALKLSEERYREVVEGTREGIVVTQDGMIRFFNSKTLEMTGYSSAEIADRPFLELIHRDDSDVVGERHEARLAGGEVPDAYPMRVVRGDGDLLWVQVSAVVIEWEGRPAVLAFLSDITERVALEQRMFEYEQLDRMKSDLLTTVSHELRTPLAIIQGYSTLILGYEERLGVDEKHGYLRSIDEATHRLAELVDHLLDMSRLDAGLMKLDTAPHSAAQLVSEVVQEGLVRYPGHRISSELEENLPDTNMDGKRIRQVLDNLLDNACKYSEDGTEVLVSARQTGQELLLSVSDQGIGIPDDEMEKVFDRLHRIENRLTEGIGGIGLGLSISKGLVEAHGGRIWAESAEGEGSTFSLVLPL